MNREAAIGPKLPSELPGDAIKVQVRNAPGPMPAFGPDVLSDEDLEKILAYMRTPLEGEPR